MYGNAPHRVYEYTLVAIFQRPFPRDGIFIPSSPITSHVPQSNFENKKNHQQIIQAVTRKTDIKHKNQCNNFIHTFCNTDHACNILGQLSVFIVLRIFNGYAIDWQ